MKKQKRTEIPSKPYERFLSNGPDALTESELLAVILRTGTRDMDAMAVADEVMKLAKYPREGLLGLYDLSVEDFTELSARISKATAKQGLTFTESDKVAEYFMEQLRHRSTECVILVSLDAKGQVLKESELSNGSVRMSLISSREIFLEALRQKAVNILLVHNHPSGDPAPSECDKDLTRQVAQAGDLLGIPLLDHIIIGDNRYTSFKELDLL